MAKATASAQVNAPIRFKFLNETKGAVRYEEVDNDGKSAEPDKMKIGSLYFRKSQFAKISGDYASTGKPSEFLSVQVTALDK